VICSVCFPEILTGNVLPSDSLEETMNETSHNRHKPFMHDTFWVENQVSFTFAPTESGDPTEIINLADLDDFLEDHGFIRSFIGDSGGSNSADQHALVERAAHRATGNYPGIYVFPPAIPGEKIRSLVAAFFQFTETQDQSLLPEDTSQQGHQTHQGHVDLGSTPVARLVNLVNEHLQTLSSGQERLKNGRQLEPIPIIAAAPHWYCGASNGNSNGPITTGCPLTPPIPVAADAACAASPGLWPIRLPNLPRELKQMTGDGVTVFVLDSLPSEGDIRRAALAAGEHNLLLLDLINNVTFTYPDLPEVLERPSPQQTMTGKDICGRAIGFRMPDHGLFVAGIIRDVAPNARVECIRVLNDFCVGTVQVLTEQLYGILQRNVSGDVVINMSLVTPDDVDVRTSGIDLALARQGLLEVIGQLSARGVIFVASAGNEGDKRYMQPEEEHPKALYPAAYAYPLGQDASVATMIPVGAVNHEGGITSYSCYPGSRGVSTYGGETPSKEAIFKDAATGMTEVDTRQIDAVIGVYTQLFYPALSYDDPEATYPAPNAYGWAYWIGTSFATPIISAVVARVLELRRRRPLPDLAELSTTSIIKYATQKKVYWPVGSGRNAESIPGLMIPAEQCRPFEKRHKRQKVQEQAEKLDSPHVGAHD